MSADVWLIVFLRFSNEVEDCSFVLLRDLKGRDSALECQSGSGRLRSAQRADPTSRDEDLQ